MLDFLLSLFAKKAPPVKVPTATVDLPFFPLDADEMRACIIAAGGVPAYAPMVAAAFTSAFKRFGVLNSLPIAHILAHCAHESSGFTRTIENLNYSAERLLEVFPKRVSPEIARQIAHNEPAIGERVYGMRADLGNILAGDGYAFRGRWYPQLTGRATVEAFAEYLTLSLSALMQRDDPDINALAAVWFATTFKAGLIGAAMSDDLERTTRIWNGGINGLPDRRRRLTAIKSIMRLP
jgi:putative chitinase